MKHLFCYVNHILNSMIQVFLGEYILTHQQITFINMKNNSFLLFCIFNMIIALQTIFHSYEIFMFCDLCCGIFELICLSME